MANFFKPKVKTQLTKEELNVRIDKLDVNGVAIARWQGKPLFIAGALPGELVTVQVVEQKNKYARAKLISVNKASENRVQPQCKHFGLCGGCDLQMLSIEAQLLFKQHKIEELFSRSYSREKLLNNNTHLSLPWCRPIKSQPWHYRRKARIGVQFDKKSKATIGFRQRSTNQLASIKSCPVLTEPLSDIFPLLKKLVSQLSVKSAVGHIEVIQADVEVKPCVDVETTNQGAVLVVRQLKPMNAQDVSLWKTYAIKHNWHVFVDDGKKQAPLFSDKNVEQVNLSYALTDKKKVYFDSHDFIQINHDVNIAMIDQALTWLNLKKSDIVLDLFCGLGNFSLALASYAKQVVGVEGVQVMVAKAEKNAIYNQLGNCQFYQSDLNSDWSQQPWAITNTYNKALLDPARAGAEQAVEQIIKMNIATVLYVSCDPATLARDSAILVSNGYKIEKISLMDMFSQTKHVETMVLFTL